MNNPLERQMNEIEIPKQLHARCVQGIRCANQEMEEPKMNETKKKTVSFRVVKRTLIVAAALAVCAAALGGTALADSLKGFFVDVTRWDGAVVGSEYHASAEEICLEAQSPSVEGYTVILPLTVTFQTPDAFPFRELDEVALGDYSVLDAAGNEVAAAESSIGRVEDGMARLELYLSVNGLSAGEYTLAVRSLTGGSKADAPLPIFGSWSCSFEVG